MSAPLVIEAGCCCGDWFVCESGQDWFTRALFETWKDAHFGRLTPAHRQVTVARAREVRALDETIAASPTLARGLEAAKARQELIRRWSGPFGPLQPTLGGSE